MFFQYDAWFLAQKLKNAHGGIFTLGLGGIALDNLLEKLKVCGR
jgi:hypothetical protein